MGVAKIDPAEFTPYEDAVSRLLALQPWWVRRKDSLTAAAGVLLQVANLAFAYTDHAPSWVATLVAVVIGVCQIAVHAGTKGAVTPSMGERLAEVGPAVVLAADAPATASTDVAATITTPEPTTPPPVVEAGRHRAEE